MQIRCPFCRNPIEYADEVKLDIINTFTHKYCETQFEVKDSGPFKELVKKHDLLEEVDYKEALIRKAGARALQEAKKHESYVVYMDENSNMVKEYPNGKIINIDLDNDK